MAHLSSMWSLFFQRLAWTSLQRAVTVIPGAAKRKSHHASAFQGSAKGTPAIGLIKVNHVAKPSVSISIYKGEHIKRQGQVQEHDCNGLP